MPETKLEKVSPIQVVQKMKVSDEKVESKMTTSNTILQEVPLAKPEIMEPTGLSESKPDLNDHVLKSSDSEKTLRVSFGNAWDGSISKICTIPSSDWTYESPENSIGKLIIRGLV